MPFQTRLCLLRIPDKPNLPGVFQTESRLQCRFPGRQLRDRRRNRIPDMPTFAYVKLLFSPQRHRGHREKPKSQPQRHKEKHKNKLKWVGETLVSLPSRTAVSAVLNRTGETPVLPEGDFRHKTRRIFEKSPLPINFYILFVNFVSLW